MSSLHHQYCSCKGQRVDLESDGRGSPEALGRYAKTCSLRETTQVSGKTPGALRRAKLADALRHLGTHRTRWCRKKVVGEAVQLQRLPTGGAKLVGVETCGSVWGCAICAPAIYTQRSSEVMHAVTEWRASGGYVYMMTNTIAHQQGDDLKRMRRGLSVAWSRYWQGKAGKERRQRLMKMHHIRAIEVTSGENGFHPHVHSLLFLDRELTSEDKLELAEVWKKNVVLTHDLGVNHLPDDVHGTHITESFSDNYIAKLGMEVAAITTKFAKHGNKTMWTVAQDAADGSKRDAAIWHTYVRAMKGCRSMFWSKNSKKYFRIARMTDQQIAEQAALTEGEGLGVTTTLARWVGHDWREQARTPYWLTRVLTTTYGTIHDVLALPGQSPEVPKGSVTDGKPVKLPVRCSMQDWQRSLMRTSELRDIRARAKKLKREKKDNWRNELDRLRQLVADYKSRATNGGNGKNMLYACPVSPSTAITRNVEGST